MRGPSRQVAQAYLGFKLGVWSYNGAVKHWEPVVEPWDVIAQCAANHGSRVSGCGAGEAGRRGQPPSRASGLACAWAQAAQPAYHRLVDTPPPDPQMSSSIEPGVAVSASNHPLLHNPPNCA